MNFMEQTLQEADDAYAEQLKFNDKKYNELNNNQRFNKLMRGKAQKVYTPHNWDGINLPELHLNFHESLPDHHTVKARTIPCTMQQPVSKELKRLQKYHLLESHSPYASALVVAPKATTPYVRMCGDYRWINQYILIQHEWIPNVLENLQKLQGFQYYIDIDLTNAFHQIRIDKATSEKLSILTPDGLFRPKFLPEGVAPASAILQRHMKTIFKDFAEHTLVIFDNIVIGANSIDELLDRYEAVLDKCIEYNVVLKLSKSTFALKSVQFFGYVVDKDGWRFDTERLQGLNTYEFPSQSQGTPAEKKTLIEQFLGAANFFRPAYIHAPGPHSSSPERAQLWIELTSPLYDMTHKTFDWNPSVCDYPRYKNAFDALKSSLLDCAKIYFPDYSLPWILRTDASSIGLGAVLYQQRSVSTPEGVEEIVSEPIATVSHKFSDPATRWATIKQELYAIYHAVSKLQHLLHGKTFVCETDHANLEHLEVSQVAILVRWRLFLQQFNFRVRHIPGKVNLVADALSRQWLKEDTPSDADLPPSELNGYPEHFIAEFQQTEIHAISSPEQEPVCQNKAFKPLDPRQHPPVSKLEESRKHTQHIEEYDKLIRDVHGASNLHFGVDTTWKKLSSLYPGHQIPRHYIDFYISRCPHCQKAYGNQRNNVTVAQVRHLVPPTIRSTVGMDMIEIDEDQHGYRYAHVIVNQFSKYVFIYPTKSANAHEAAKALLRYIATVGPVRTLRTDPGANYVSDTVKEFNKLVGIAHQISLVDRHESNGVEPVNNQIKRHLNVLLKELKYPCWSEAVDLIQLEMNTIPRSATGGYDAMTLQLGELEPDLDFHPKFDNNQAYTRFVQSLSENQSMIRKASIKLRKEAAEKLDEHNNEGYTLHQQGDLVFARTSPKVGKKHGPYLGPYIVETQYKNDVTVVHLSTQVRRVVHVDHVKAFHGDLIQAKALAQEDNDEYELEEILYYTGNPLIRTTLEFHCKFRDDDEPRKLLFKDIKNNEALDVLIAKDKSLLPLTKTTHIEANTMRKDLNKQLLPRSLYDKESNTLYVDVRCRAIFPYDWYVDREFPVNQLCVAAVTVEPRNQKKGSLLLKFQDPKLSPIWKSKPFSINHFQFLTYAYTPDELNDLDHRIVTSNKYPHALHAQVNQQRKNLRIASFNVNGLRAAITNGLFAKLPPDLDHLCIQEVKAAVKHQDKLEQLVLTSSDFKHVSFHLHDSKGYAGVAICSKIPPLDASHQICPFENACLIDKDFHARILTLVYAN